MAGSRKTGGPLANNRRLAQIVHLASRRQHASLRVMAAKVREYMTASPHTIGFDQTLEHAASLLREHNIRHLPVLNGGYLVGVLTERDIALVETLKGVEPSKERAEDAMSQDCYTVTPEAMMSEVTAEMAEHKYGSAIVTERGKVIGVLTTVDVCRAFSELERRTDS